MSFNSTFNFVDDKVFAAALKVWRRYHQQTEDFDRSVCSRFDRSGTAWPMNDYERRAVTEHARRVLAVAERELVDIEGLTAVINQRAKDAAAGEPYMPPGHPYRLEPFKLPPQRTADDAADVVATDNNTGKPRTPRW